MDAHFFENLLPYHVRVTVGLMVIGLLVKTNIDSSMYWQAFLTIALLPTSLS